MSKTALLAIMGILFTITGCWRNSQQPAASSQAAGTQAPAPKGPPTQGSIATAPAPTPTGLPTTESTESLCDWTSGANKHLIGYPHSGQLEAQPCLLSSDSDFTVRTRVFHPPDDSGYTIVLYTANHTKMPVIVGADNVVVTDAEGRHLNVYTREGVRASPISPSTKSSLLDQIWDSFRLDASTHQLHIQILDCSNQVCTLPITVHLTLNDRAYDFSFRHANEVQPSTADQPTKSSSTGQVQTILDQLQAIRNGAKNSPTGQLPLYDAEQLANQAGQNTARFNAAFFTNRYIRLRGQIDSINKAKAGAFEGQWFVYFHTGSSANDHTGILVLIPNEKVNTFSKGDEVTLVVRFAYVDDEAPAMATHVLAFFEKDYL